MLEKIEGIVLDTLKFKESSVVAKVFSKNHGLLSILINGVSDKKSKHFLVYLQPLSHIEFQLYYKNIGSINKATDIIVLNSPLGPVSNIVKNSIVIFIAEVVLKTSKHQIKDNKVYDLLLETLNLILNKKDTLSSLHLYFLINYVSILGYTVYESNYNIKLAILTECNSFSYDQFLAFPISKEVRKESLNFLLSHLINQFEMIEIKSHAILGEIML